MPINPKEFETAIGALAPGGGWPRKVYDIEIPLYEKLLQMEHNFRMGGFQVKSKTPWTTTDNSRVGRWDYLSHKTDRKIHEDKWDEKI